MRVKGLLAILILSGAFLFLQAASTSAQARAYSLISVTVIPNPPAAFEISWVDPGSHRYYLADRTNAAIDVFNTEDGTFLTQYGGFVGNTGKSDTSGPDGVLVTPDSHEIWAGDGDSTVKVLDPETGSILASISTGGMMRADELAYDQADQLIVIANDADTPPYLSFISTATRSVVGKLEFPDATDGLEQPVWDPASNLIYQSVPASKTNKGGEIAVIDPHTMMITTTYPLTDCNPTGLALGPSQQLLLACTGGDHLHSDIMDATNGQIVASITQVGGADEVWYNPGDNHYYLGASGMTVDGTKTGRNFPVLGVIDAGSNQWIENIPTVTAAHSVAADPETNQIFVPLTNVGVGIYAQPLQ